MAIKAIIFDMEDVLMKTGEKDLSTCWAKALNAPYETVHAVFYGEMNDKADLGVVTQSEFDRYLITTLGLEMDMLPIVQKLYYEECFIDQALAQKIFELKNDFKIALLSNHTQMMRDKIENEWDIKHLFDEIIISFEVGCIKPDPAIFDLTISRLGVSAFEAVLIDDRIKNIEGALQYGMHAILYKTREQALEELDRLIASEI